MARVTVRKFSSADETRKFGHGHVDLVKVGEGVVGRAEFEPGWKWSTDVRPVAGTASCMAAHEGYVVQGRMRVHMDDGSEVELAPGDYCSIPPGHDAWVVGDETCVMIDVIGMQHYAEGRAPQQFAGAEQPQAGMH